MVGAEGTVQFELVSMAMEGVGYTSKDLTELCHFSESTQFWLRVQRCTQLAAKLSLEGRDVLHV